MRIPHDRIDTHEWARELAEVVESRGYTVGWGEMPYGGGWSNWKNRTDDVLRSLFPLEQTGDLDLRRMSLAVGSRLGPYSVTAFIREGGMGQVYQATDTKLNHQIALKFLPEAFAADPDRLARFQREAQVLASPNHPKLARDTEVG